MLRVNDNGGWCWFQGERAVVHNEWLYVGSVANKAGPGGEKRHGNIEVTAVDLRTGNIVRSSHAKPVASYNFLIVDVGTESLGAA